MHDLSSASLTETPHANALLEMLDTSAPGTTCALLTPAIKAKLRELQPGQVLEVRVGDPEAREDIAAWCRLSGHALLTMLDDQPGRLRCFIRKK